MLLQALSTSIFLSFCSVFGKLDPRHMTIGASLLVLFLRNGIEPVSHCVEPLLLPGLSTTKDERPPLLIVSNSCSLVLGHPSAPLWCGVSGEFVDDAVNDGSAFDAPPPLPLRLVRETGLEATSKGDFFINSAKSMPLDEGRKLLLPPNNSSNVCMLSPLSDRGPDRDHWSSAEKSNGFIVFIGAGTELESGGGGSANDMDAGSLASMLNVC